MRRKPSQVANPFATVSIWSGLTAPSLRIAKAFGKVDTPCTRKAPGRRNGTVTSGFYPVALKVTGIVVRFVFQVACLEPICLGDVS